MAEPAEEDDDAGADRPEERRQPQRRAQEPRLPSGGRARAAAGRGGARLRGVSRRSRVTSGPPPDTARARRAASSLSVLSYVSGITLGLVPGRERRVRVDDRFTDELLERRAAADRWRPGSARPAHRCPQARTRGSRRSPALVKTASPEFSSPPPAAEPATNSSYSAWSTTRTCARIVGCPSPHSSVQTIENSPFRFGVITSVVSTPGHGIRLLPELGNPERVDHVERAQCQLRRPCSPAGRAGPR